MGLRPPTSTPVSLVACRAKRGFTLLAKVLSLRFDIGKVVR